MTLRKGQGLRVMFVAMRAGTVIQSHQDDSPISLQVIEVVLKFSTNRQTLTLRQGQLPTLQAGIPHGVEAVGESACLLTLAPETPHPVEPYLKPGCSGRTRDGGIYHSGAREEQRR
jgi:quercetin dioxygenase-like cupin family protein